MTSEVKKNADINFRALESVGVHAEEKNASDSSSAAAAPAPAAEEVAQAPTRRVSRPRDFSTMYARVKEGHVPAAPPYRARTVPSAACKRCGAKVEQTVTAIDHHDAVCGRRGAVVEEVVKGVVKGEQREKEQEETCEEEEEEVALEGEVSQPSPMSRSFSASTLELDTSTLSHRLSIESRTVHKQISDKNVSSDEEHFPPGGAEESSVAEISSPSSWQRYSVVFGAGRMGLEFEYDAKHTRRLLVTRVSRDAAALGVRARDVLIGIGKRAVPRATDPLAVQRHLIACPRPVTLHFYRLHHVRRIAHLPPTAEEPAEEALPSKPKISTTQAVVGATAAGAVRLFETVNVFGRFMRQSSTTSTTPPLPEEEEEEEGPLPEKPRRRSVVATPPLVLDAKRYLEEAASQMTGDPRADEALLQTRCLASAEQRRAICKALKPGLKPRAWELLYDSRIDGMSLECLYARTTKKRGSKQHGAQLVFVRDDKEAVAGAFVDEPIKRVGDYYGTGECFVFELLEQQSSSSTPKEETASSTEEDSSSGSSDDDEDDRHARIYRWVGPGGSPVSQQETPPAPLGQDLSRAGDELEKVEKELPPPIPSLFNDMFIYATHSVLGFGSGGGGFALRLDENLEYGASRPCETYGNRASLFRGRESFAVESVQIWTFVSQSWR